MEYGILTSKRHRFKTFIFGSLAMVVIVGVILYSVFMPTILLKPSIQTQNWIKENNVMITPGLFYLSNNTLDDLIKVSDEMNLSETECCQQLKKISKQGKGALVSEIVMFDICMLTSANETEWDAAENSIWEFEQVGETVAIHGGGNTIRVDGFYRKWDGKTEQKGYKIY